MRYFYTFFFKNITWIYLSAILCFAYATMMESIPEHVYLEEGQELSLDGKLPVTLAVNTGGQAVMADVGQSTYEIVRQREQSTCGELSVGEHTLTCYLLGVIPIREVALTVVEGEELYACGHVTGIYGKAQGVLVLGTSPVETADGSYATPAENLLAAGDYITEVNGQEVGTKEELVEVINEDGADAMVLTLWRQEEQIEVEVTAAAAPANSENAYMLGIWVKDDLAGIGTITYYRESGAYGALGHGISDGQTGDLLRLSSGRLYFAEILKIIRGKRGNPGEIEGVIYYGKENQIGSVESNTDIGIYGVLNQDYCRTCRQEDERYPVGYKQEVQTGDAYIQSDVSGEERSYHIVIDSLDYGAAESNKGIRFHVDDDDLISLTGGIVQGLSGSPIIQNGKIVGAVTHVLVSDPTRGYGIFIENMLNIG
jgi:stage IV sporulation protein B